MADITLKWHDSALRRLTHDPAGPVGVDLRRRAQNGVQFARSMAPVLTGATVRGIESRVEFDESGLFADVVSTAVNPAGFPYPLLHEFRDPFLRPALQAMRR